MTRKLTPTERYLLTQRGYDATFAVEAEPAQQCDFCGEIRELRPYGPNGEAICHPCGMKDEAAAKARFHKMYFEEPRHD